MRNTVFVCHNPIETYWQLGQISTVGGNFTLIGWDLSSTLTDGGMPETVAGILARAMTSTANVIFLSSNVNGGIANDWKTIGDDAVCVLKENNPLRCVLNALSNRTSDFTLLSTRNPKAVIELFDDGIYSWWMQGQVILLSEPERATPKINRQILLALFEEDWTRQASQLQSVGIQSVLRPGVDGSVAGFLFLTDAFRITFLKALEEESRAAEFDWSLLSETDFASSLAG